MAGLRSTSKSESWPHITASSLASQNLCFLTCKMGIASPIPLWLVKEINCLISPAKLVAPSVLLLAHSSQKTKTKRRNSTSPWGFPRAARQCLNPPLLLLSTLCQDFVWISFQRYHCCHCEWVKGDLKRSAVLSYAEVDHDHSISLELLHWYLNSGKLSQIFTGRLLAVDRDFLEKSTSDSPGQTGEGQRMHWETPPLSNPRWKDRKKTSGKATVPASRLPGLMWDH